MTEIPTLEPAALERLARTFRGRLIRPDDAAYDEARALWNGMIDRRPALVARPADAADVAAAVRFAGERGLRVAVRAGGHNVAGKAVLEDGLVVDVSHLRGVRVDPETRIARVEPGARLGDLDRATQAHGLATTGGVDSRTGVAGLTLGGGLGFLARRHGLATDNLRAAEVVLADGSTVRASADEHPDLYWALRGGGGDFGVVTAFEFRLHEVGPEVWAAQLFHPIEAAGEVLRAYRDAMAAAPDDVSCYALFVHVPPVEPFPEAQHGRPCLALVAVHSGPLAEGEAALAPFARIGAPMLAAVAPMPYVTLQSSFDAGTPDGERYYFKARFLDALPDEAIEALLEGLGDLPGAFTGVGLEPMGGAVNRVPADATAFPHRAAAYSLGVWAGWSDPADDDAVMGWARDLNEALAPWSSGGAYLNYLDRDDGGRDGVAFGPNLERLRAIKRRYDPEGRFRASPRLAHGG